MSTKLPPKQQTQIFRSSRELTKTANFRQFIGRLLSVGVELDPVRTHAGPGDSFEFELVHTKTSIGHLIRTTLSSGSISGVFPRNARLEQHVLIVGVLKGTLALTQRGETRHFKHGDFLIFDPHMNMTVLTKKPACFVSILVSESYFYTHAGFRSASFYGTGFNLDSEVQNTFSAVLGVLADKLTLVDARDVADMCDGAFRFLRPVLAEFTRLHHAGLQRHDDFVRACAVDVMHHYFNEPGLTREKIAQKVGVSTRYLAKLFAQTGTTVMDRLKEIRLTRGSVQLTEEHMAHASIQEIAKTNGFASTAHFCRAFKERFEMTPRQWRQAHLDFNETENP